VSFLHEKRLRPDFDAVNDPIVVEKGRKMLSPPYEFKDWRLTMKTCKFLALGIVLFAALASSTMPRAGAQDTKALLLFGGADHKTFLGCLNCTSASSGSVCNEYGKGSEYASESIWNEYGTYGSEYSQYSPWNSYSDSAPIIVDRDGKSYGYFSVNAYHHDRTRIDWIVALLDFYEKKNDLDETRKRLCGD
jgi:hypothetical protein